MLHDGPFPRQNSQISFRSALHPSKYAGDPIDRCIHRSTRRFFVNLLPCFLRRDDYCPGLAFLLLIRWDHYKKFASNSRQWTDDVSCPALGPSLQHNHASRASVRTNLRYNLVLYLHIGISHMLLLHSPN